MSNAILSDIEETARRIHEVLVGESTVAAAYLFGSVARAATTPASDVDIGLVFRRGALNREGVMASVAAAVGRRLAVDAVDVVDLEAQGPIFCHEVLCDGVRVHSADDERRVDFESDVIARALDFRPTYDLATRGKMGAMRRWLRERYDLGTDPIQAGHPEGEPRTPG